MDENKLAPPPGLGFDEEKGEAEVKKATKVPSAYMVKREQSRIPDNLNLYEQNVYVQTFLVVVTAIVAIANLTVNFEMLKVYIDQELVFNNAKALPGPDAGQAATLTSEFENRTAAGEALCDVAYFASSSFDIVALQNTVFL